MGMTNSELAKFTGIHANRWFEWWNGRYIGEESIVKISEVLEQTPGTVLDWIRERRKIDPSDPDSFKNKHTRRNKT